MIAIITAIAAVTTSLLLAWQILLKMKDSYPNIQLQSFPVRDNLYVLHLSIYPGKKQTSFTKISAKNAFVSILQKPQYGLYNRIYPKSLPTGPECLIRFAVPPSVASTMAFEMQLSLLILDSSKSARISLHTDSAWPWARISKRILTINKTD